ncbi:MAG TPA: hypothetical protein VKU60_07080 [Chloroflexota bacterium]|nr:hypothetical protein [Chloroflexota bacterium]
MLDATRHAARPLLVRPFEGERQLDGVRKAVGEAVLNPVSLVTNTRPAPREDAAAALSLQSRKVLGIDQLPLDVHIDDAVGQVSGDRHDSAEYLSTVIDRLPSGPERLESFGQ